MTGVQKELENAMRILSAIPVSGDSVDFMAAARQRLRKAIELCKQISEEGSDPDG